jgi:high-affinity iron transporter
MASGEAPGAGAALAPGATVHSPELQRVLAQLDSAESAYQAGDGAGALARVERLYLDGIEPLESRLPQTRVHEIERAVHLGVRAAIGGGAPARETLARFAELRGRLVAADGLLGPGAPAWLGAANAFFVLVREGLEAVLLVAALLAYLAAAGAGVRARRQIWAGVGAGILATGATWAVATALIPMGGASRELVEGVTGLVAVGVLLYVSNWLFQKTYIHDWKQYLRQHVGQAVSTGSALAMASLAFAAVYREGFETVLFYKALLFDAGPRAVLTGAVPGAILIGGLGYGIIRLGVKLPLKKVFALTNAVLLYLAFTFVGKGLYSLQEAGLFAPHPLPVVPDAILLRQLFGVYPVVETLAAQLLFVLGVAATYAHYRRRLSRQRAPLPLPRGDAARAAPGTPRLGSPLAGGRNAAGIGIGDAG